MKILMVLTSHDELGDTGNKTGFWLEEFATKPAFGSKSSPPPTTSSKTPAPM